MKKSIVLFSSMAVCVGLLTTSVFAAPPTSKKGSDVKKPVVTSTTTSTETEVEKSQADVIKAKIEGLKKELAKVNEKIKYFEGKVTGAPATEKDTKDPKEQKNPKDQKTEETAASLDQSLNKMAEQDKAEVEKLNEEYQSWKVHIENTVARLNEVIAKIDEKLKTDLAAIDVKIAAATDATVKASLQSERDAMVKAAADKKAAINKYITSLKEIWAERQKVFEERKAIQAKRQAADLEFKTTLVAIQKDGLSSSTTVENEKDTVKPSKESAKFQPVINALKAKAARIQEQIKVLEAQLAALPADSTATTPTSSTSTSTTPTE